MAKQKVRAGIAASGFAATFHYEAFQRVFIADGSITGLFLISPESCSIHGTKAAKSD
ncbi:MAG: hypothetical protein ABI472_11345 [Ginsengibacter sp.]